MTDSLQATEDYSAARSTHPRVSLDDIKHDIQHYAFINAGAALAEGGKAVPESTLLLTLCIMTMRNGFVVLGKSAPASPENFDQEKGETFAYEDAIRQLWPLMGYALRQKLYEARAALPQ